MTLVSLSSQIFTQLPCQYWW